MFLQNNFLNIKQAFSTETLLFLKSFKHLIKKIAINAVVSKIYLITQVPDLQPKQCYSRHLQPL